MKLQRLAQQRAILDSESSSDSDTPYKRTPIRNVLSQHKENANGGNRPSDHTIINMKEQIAQAISNLKVKEQENSKLRKEVQELKGVIAQLEQQNRKNQQKIAMERQFGVKRQFRVKQVDSELLIKQLEFYQKQIAVLKAVKQHKQTHSETRREMAAIQRQNNRLKEDIKRMYAIFEEYGCKEISDNIEGKHYMGAVRKEWNRWVDYSLILQVECFIKQQEVTLIKKKEFVDSLVRFIHNLTNRRDVTSKVHNKSHKSSVSCYKVPNKKKPRMRTSMSLLGDISAHPATQVITSKNMGNSFGFSTNPRKSMNKSVQIVPDSYPLKSENEPTTSAFMSQNRECRVVLEEYYDFLKTALQEKPLRRKHIGRVSRQMGSSVLALLRTNEA